jgi:hypothetical protein
MKKLTTITLNEQDIFKLIKEKYGDFTEEPIVTMKRTGDYDHGDYEEHIDEIIIEIEEN